MRHPKQRSPWTNRVTRREFIRTSAGGALALSGAGAFLAACGRASNPSQPIGEQPTGSSALQLARRDHPVTWPIYPDNAPIASDLQPEKKATLKIYNWEEYIWRKVVNDFADHYGCKVEISTFSDVTSALRTLTSKQADYDVYFPDPSLVGKLVTGRLIRPLNLDYIPNLANVWPSLQSPFYDMGSRYTVPYTLYSTGIGWRNDHVPDDVPALSNPYDIFWNQAYKGKTHLLDDYREPICMALLRRGITDINTADPKLIDMAKEDLLELVDLVAVKFDTNDYTDLPDGGAWVHQSWSGDLVSAQYYLARGTSITDLSYWYPPDGGGVVGQDNIAVLKTGRNPVLAHLFLNWMLDNKIAYSNFVNFNGYQPPMNDINPERLVADEAVPQTLTSVVVRPDDFDKGYTILELSPSVDAMWQGAYNQIQAGA